MELLGVRLEDTEGLYSSGVHDPLLSSMLEALYALRSHLHDFRGTAVLTFRKSRHRGKMGVAMILKSEKPKFIFEVQFYPAELRVVSVSLDNRCRGRRTPIIPKILMRAITDPRDYVRITLRAGAPSGYLVWLKYGFYPEPKALQSYAPLLSHGWDGLASGLISMSRNSVYNSLIHNLGIYFEGYIDLRDRYQVALALEYILRRANNGR